jgi:hypothetical protein
MITTMEASIIYKDRIQTHSDYLDQGALFFLLKPLWISKLQKLEAGELGLCPGEQYSSSQDGGMGSLLFSWLFVYEILLQGDNKNKTSTKTLLCPQNILVQAGNGRLQVSRTLDIVTPKRSEQKS